MLVITILISAHESSSKGLLFTIGQHFHNHLCQYLCSDEAGWNAAKLMTKDNWPKKKKRQYKILRKRTKLYYLLFVLSVVALVSVEDHLNCIRECELWE